MPRNQGNQAAWKQHAGPSAVGGPFDGSQNSELSGLDTALFDTSVAPIGQNLPLAAGSVGRTITYVNTGTAGNALTVSAQGGDTLNWNGGAPLADGASATFRAIDSTTWQAVGAA